MISFLISLIILIIVCSLVWWGAPIVLPDTISPRNKQRIAILVCLVIILIWLSGGFGWGWADSPWGWYGPHRRGR